MPEKKPVKYKLQAIDVGPKDIAKFKVEKTDHDTIVSGPCPNCKDKVVSVHPNVIIIGPLSRVFGIPASKKPFVLDFTAQCNCSTKHGEGTEIGCGAYWQMKVIDE